MEKPIEQKKAKKITLEFEEATAWKIATCILAVALVISILTGGFGISPGESSGSGDSDILPLAPPGNNPPQRADVELKDARTMGKKNAPVTIIEFSDFQCPFCRKYWRESYPQIKKEYVDTGKVFYAYRHLPLGFHPFAQPAAEAAECAADQNKFWELHDKIFEEQDKLGQGTVQPATDDLKKWAQELGLDMNKFNECVSSGKYTKKVQDDLADAAKYGATGTPTFFINGQIVVGAQPYASFKQAIDAELSN